MLADPQLAHRGALAEVKDKGGIVQSGKSAVPILRRAGPGGEFAASLGQHTREILELAGYAAEEIEKMSAEGIVVLQ